MRRAGLVLAGLAACGDDGAAPPPGAPGPAGPFLGTALAVADGALWASAPGLDGEGGAILRLAGGSFEPVVLAGAAGDVGGAFAVCGDAVLVGAPAVGAAGGAWVAAPGDTLGGQAFLPGFYAGGAAGAAVACADLDGDDVPEAVIAEPDADGPQPATGALGIWALGGPDKVAQMDTTWAGGRLGGGGGPAGADLDGDGVGDLLVGARGAERVHWVRGPVSGTVFGAETPMFIGEDGDGTGAAVAIGDVTGDGVADAVFGAPDWFDGRGGVWFLPGPLEPGGATLRSRGTFVAGIAPGAHLGAVVALAGDVDGDGAADVLVGAPDAPGAADEAGAAYLLLSGSWPGMADIDGADALLLPDEAGGHAGAALAAGDLDGDGVVELYVGAPGAAVDEVPGVGEVLVWPATVRGTAYPDQGLARLRRGAPVGAARSR